MNGVSKETFLQVDGEARWGLLYDILQGIHDRIGECRSEMGPRVAKLEKKQHKDTAISAGTGFLGGAAVILAKLIFWR